MPYGTDPFLLGESMDLEKDLKEISELEERFLRAGEKTDEIPKVQEPGTGYRANMMLNLLNNTLESSRAVIELVKDSPEGKSALAGQEQRLTTLMTDISDAQKEIDALLSGRDDGELTSPEEEEPEEESPEDDEEEVETEEEPEDEEAPEDDEEEVEKEGVVV